MSDKIYICMSCGLEAWSLVCRRIDGEDWDVCSDCFEEKVKANAIGNCLIILNAAKEEEAGK